MFYCFETSFRNEPLGDSPLRALPEASQILYTQVSHGPGHVLKYWVNLYSGKDEGGGGRCVLYVSLVAWHAHGTAW